MSTIYILAAALVLFLLGKGSIQHVPAGRVRVMRRRNGRSRLLASGLHLACPLYERAERDISLAGATVTVDADSRGSRAHVYFQVLDPARTGQGLAEVDRLLASETRELLAAAPLAQDASARCDWLKQRLNHAFDPRGVRIARVDLEPVA